MITGNIAGNRNGPKLTPVSQGTPGLLGNAYVETLTKQPFDPRPDLEDDHTLWVTVMMIAQRRIEWDRKRRCYPQAKQAAATLHGFRCYDARLEVKSSGALKLNFDRVCEHVAEDRGISIEEARHYLVETWLNPIKSEVAEIFREAANRPSVLARRPTA